MPDMYFDVDTAITECPVNILPLIDATDFKTIEDAVAYNAAGMALYWHFCTSAGAYTVTAVTPTTAGDYDWTDQGAAGIYTIEIPASGGASINNDTEGYGWFTGSATGVLPWRGPVIGFRAAALNDALCDGGDNLDVNTVQWLGTACATPSVAGVPEVDLTHVAGATTNVAALATNVDAILTDTAEIGAAGAGLTVLATAANLATVAGYLDTEIAAILADTNELQTDWADGGRLDLILDAASAPSAAAVADAVWDEALAGHLGVGSTGEALNAAGAAGDPWTTALPGAYGAGSAGKIIGDNINATISSRASQTSVDTIDDLLDTEVAAIKSDTAAILIDTAEIGAAGAGLTAVALADATSDAVIADAVWNAATVTYGAAGSYGLLVETDLDAAISSRASQTSVDAVDDLLDTEVAAIKSDTAAILIDTAEIGAAGAGLTALASASNLAVVAGYLDTEIAAIKSDTAAILIDTAEIGAAGAGLTALATQTSVNTIDDLLDTEVAAIKAKTDQLTFTVANQLDANVLAVAGDTDAVTRLERVLSGNVTGTVGAGSTTTSIVTSAMSPAAAVTDQFKGRILTFDAATTTANLRGQSTDITASTAAGVLTVTALTTAAVSGDTFTVS